MLKKLKAKKVPIFPDLLSAFLHIIRQREFLYFLDKLLPAFYKL